MTDPEEIIGSKNKRWIEYFFYGSFDKLWHMAAKFEEEGFRVKSISRPATPKFKNEFCLKVERIDRPDNLPEEFLESIAVDYNCSYDGWGSSMILESDFSG